MELARESGAPTTTEKCQATLVVLAPAFHLHELGYDPSTVLDISTDGFLPRPVMPCLSVETRMYETKSSIGFQERRRHNANEVRLGRLQRRNGSTQR